MKSLDELLGMQVTGLDLKWANRHEAIPSSGLFLMFEDGTYLELQSVQGYLELGRNLPPQPGGRRDENISGYYLADSGSLPPLLEPRLDSTPR
ncbi:MAG: hypothetical protein KGK44_04410 [Gammaproteobacteria bacterium]|nr:hypothetical protein [Gammaproteobacteria bacterium]